MSRAKERLFKALNERILVVDGAMGTELQRRGLEPGGLPEAITFERPQLLRDIHGAYAEAGADIILTNTFGATRSRFSDYPGWEGRVREVNLAAVKLAREAAPGKFIAGDIGPSGLVMQPMGEATWERVYDLFHEQAKALAEAEVDLIVIETIMDLRELKAAIIAARAAYDGPIFASMFYDVGAVVMTGTDPLTHTATALACGADGVGANCSLGPDGLFPVIELMAAATAAPVLIEPNAGLAQLIGGKTVFPEPPESMAEWAVKFAEAGANLIGGCCGTTPVYIKKMAEALKGRKPKQRSEPAVSRLCSRWQTVEIGDGELIPIVGERINPTGRKKLSQSIRDRDPAVIRRDAETQVAAGAALLDVNVGVPSIDEAAAMAWAIREVQAAVKVPVIVDSPDPRALEAGLKECEGRPLVNSITAEEGRLWEVVPVIKKYGGAVIALLVDDDGIPPDVAGRRKILQKILEATDKHGIARRDVYIDCLTLPISAEPAQCLNTLRAIQQLKAEFGVRAALGTSNVSFGMPMRELLTSHFVCTAIAYGLDLPIVNPLHTPIVEAIDCANLLLNRDPQAMIYTTRYAAKEARIKAEGGHARGGTAQDIASSGKAVSKGKKGTGFTGADTEAGAAAVAPRPAGRDGKPVGSGTPPYPETGDGLGNEIAAAVLDGDDKGILALVAAAVKRGDEPLTINNRFLIGGMTEVGRRFATREFFLPQVLRSANAMKGAFIILKAELAKGPKRPKKGTMVIATVKGDVHDIGKNIVIAVMENYGYDMVDLGKNVPTEDIVRAAVEKEADIVGLSALMTTTMTRMPEVIKALRAANWQGPVIIGGAVVSVDYAREIEAAGYAEDAIKAVKVAENLLAAFRGEQEE